MLEQIWNAGLSVALSILAAALVGSGLALWARRKARREWQGELGRVQLESRIEATEQANEIAATLAQYKAETVQADQEIATVLARTTQANYEAMAVVVHKLDHITFAVDTIHTAFARIERTQAQQNKLFTARAASAAAIVALQAAKDLAAKDLEHERNTVAALQSDLAIARSPV